MKHGHHRGRGTKVPAHFSRLGLQRFGRAGTKYLFASAGVVAAAVVVVSLLTLLPNDAYKPIVHPIEEAIERVAPGGVLKRVDDQLATLLGVDKETVRNVREGLVSSGIPLASLREISTSQPANNASTPTPSASPTTPDGATAPLVEPSPTTGESPPTTDVPPPATTEPSPPPAEEPPAAEEPPPATEEPAPPATDEPPPATEEPLPTTSA